MAYFDDTWNTIFPAYDYRFLDASGDLANSGTGADYGVVSGGGLAYEEIGFFATDKAIDFDGTGSFRATDIRLQTATEGTIAFMFKTSSASVEWLFSQNVPSTDGRRFEVRIQANGSLWFRAYNTFGGTNSYTSTTTTTGLNDGLWHLVVLRQQNNATGLEWFIDQGLTPEIGTEATSGTFDVDSWSLDVFSTTSYGAGDESNIAIDGHNNNNQFTGLMAGFGMSDVAESDANIAQLFEDFDLGPPGPFFSKTIRRAGLRRLFSGDLP